MRGFLGFLFFLLSFGLALWALLGLKTAPLTGEAPCAPGPWPQVAALYTDGVVEYPLCQKGELILRLEGTLARGKGPHVLIAEGKRRLFAGEVRGERVLRLSLKGDGMVAVAFVNDLYTPPEDRNLFVREAVFLPKP
ncbi:MAG: hypothetical protein ACUVS9_05075 [Thermaceae bacterium]